jgi:ubiquinone/menaquinone biosynthesis C-methylase UbiE
MDSKMKWDAQNYQSTCGRVTEHGAKLVDVIRKMQPGRVLDLGCGTGVLTKEIAEFSGEVIGLDISESMIEKARAAYPDINFTLMDACAMPWDNYFDIVFSNAVLHFISRQDMLMENIYKVLARNGAFVCEFGASGNIAALLESVERACVARGRAYALRFYYPAADEFSGLLTKHGFSVESIITYDLDTKLTEGEPGLRNWIKQIFGVEMGWFDDAGREGVLSEIEAALRPAHWDGSNWHLANRRLQAIARKT